MQDPLVTVTKRSLRGEIKSKFTCNGKLFLALCLFLGLRLFHHFAHFSLETILPFGLLLILLNFGVDLILIDNEVFDHQHDPNGN